MFKEKPRHPGQCHSIDSGKFIDGKWTEDFVPVQAAEMNELRLASFNVWFGELAWTKRQDAMLSLLKERELHFIAFEEVTPRFLERLLQVNWIRDEYTLSDIWGTTLGAYGVLMLSKVPMKNLFMVDLPTQMGRRLLCADLAINGSTLRVGAVHLESRRSEGIMRGLQLETIFPILIESPQSVLMGDFNFCHTNELEENRLPKTHQDVWPALCDTPGWTMNSELNHMFSDYKGRQEQARYDRFLLAKKGPWQPRKIELLGTKPINASNPRIYPSDHFGLFIELTSS